MARIAGIDLPKNKRGVVGLTYIYGIGPNRAAQILDASGIDQSKKVNDWDDDDLAKIRGRETGLVRLPDEEVLHGLNEAAEEEEHVAMLETEREQFIGK